MGLEALHAARAHDRVVLGARGQLEAVPGGQDQGTAGRRQAERDRSRNDDDLQLY